MSWESDQVRLARRLLAQRALSLRTPSGKLLVLQTTDHVGQPPGGVVISLETSGCFVWDGKSPVSPFGLLASGFRADIAATLAGVLNTIYSIRAGRGPRTKAITHDGRTERPAEAEPKAKSKRRAKKP